MKKVIAILFTIGSLAFGAYAQTESKNEVFVGYSFLKQDVKFEKPNFKFDENTDSHGFNVNYTRYVGKSDNKNGVVGFTVDLGANFDNNDASLVTLMGGVVIKARNQKYFQPYVRGLAGVAREHVNRNNVFDATDIKPAYAVGAGFDVKTKAKNNWALSFGADYLGTNFRGEQQGAVRLVAGVRF